MVRTRGVTVVDNDQDVVALVEDSVADATGEAVVPETAVAHEADGALAGFFRVESGGAGPTEAVSHRGSTDVERRQRGKQMAADVAGHVVGA